MPKYRSITISIISQWDMKQYPEFPHPDSSQFQFKLSPTLQGSSSDQDQDDASASSSLISSDSKADKILGRNPSIAVYIPSLPGKRFYIRYSIAPPHLDGQLFYFKLFMNGRHMNSWGVNPRTKPKGQVTRLLFQADSKWDFLNRMGKALKHGGTESRFAFFSGENDKGGAANDGGLIEIRVFRANGKCLKAAEPEPFRPQTEYGISCPSAGLIDQPQDSRYYDWLLIDAKDSPYATFRFHYRNWDFLESLQLIPPCQPRTLLAPSSSFVNFNFCTEKLSAELTPNLEELEAKDFEHEDMDDEPSIKLDNSACWTSPITMRTMPAYIHGGEDVDSSPQIHDAPLSPSPSSEHSARRLPVPVSAFSVPDADLNEWTQERPLPDIPNYKESLSLTRPSSAASDTPSITPSLMPWIDRTSESPEPILGTAHTESFMRSPNASLMDESPPSSGSDSPRDMQFNIKPVVSRFNTAPPAGTVFIAPNVTIRKSSHKRQLTGPLKYSARLKPLGLLEDDDDPFISNASTVCEASWLSKPSPLSTFKHPVKRDIGDYQTPGVRTFGAGNHKENKSRMKSANFGKVQPKDSGDEDEKNDKRHGMMGNDELAKVGSCSQVEEASKNWI